MAITGNNSIYSANNNESMTLGDMVDTMTEASYELDDDALVVIKQSDGTIANIKDITFKGNTICISTGKQ